MIINYQQRIYIRFSMLAHSVFFKKCFGWNSDKERIFSGNYILYFILFMAVVKREYYLSTMIYIIHYLLDHLLFCSKTFWLAWKQYFIYSCHFMLAFTVFMDVPPSDYYLFTKSINQTFYIISSWII